MTLTGLGRQPERLSLRAEAIGFFIVLQTVREANYVFVAPILPRELFMCPMYYRDCCRIQPRRDDRDLQLRRRHHRFRFAVGPRGGPFRRPFHVRPRRARHAFRPRFGTLRLWPLSQPLAVDRPNRHELFRRFRGPLGKVDFVFRRIQQQRGRRWVHCHQRQLWLRQFLVGAAAHLWISRVVRFVAKRLFVGLAADGVESG